MHFGRIQRLLSMVSGQIKWRPRLPIGDGHIFQFLQTFHVAPSQIVFEGRQNDSTRVGWASFTRQPQGRPSKWSAQSVGFVCGQSTQVRFCRGTRTPETPQPRCFTPGPAEATRCWPGACVDIIWGSCFLRVSLLGCGLQGSQKKRHPF